MTKDLIAAFESIGKSDPGVKRHYFPTESRYVHPELPELLLASTVLRTLSQLFTLELNYTCKSFLFISPFSIPAG